MREDVAGLREDVAGLRECSASMREDAARLLVVLVPPSLALQLTARYPLLNLNGMLNNNFMVQYSPDLAGTNWMPLQTFSNLLVSPYQFLDPAGMVAPAWFYRVLM